MGVSVCPGKIVNDAGTLETKKSKHFMSKIYGLVGTATVDGGKPSKVLKGR